MGKHIQDSVVARLSRLPAEWRLFHSCLWVRHNSSPKWPTAYTINRICSITHSSRAACAWLKISAFNTAICEEDIKGANWPLKSIGKSQSIIHLPFAQHVSGYVSMFVHVWFIWIDLSKCHFFFLNERPLAIFQLPKKTNTNKMNVHWLYIFTNTVPERPANMSAV